MEKYKTQRDLAGLMGLKNRGSISIYIHQRVPTVNYDKNTKRIKQWIFEATENYKCYK